MPFEFRNSQQQYVGIDIDLLSAIASDQGFEYDLKPLGFSASVSALDSGQVDAVFAGMSITAARQKKYDFSTPYYYSGVVMAVNADTNEISSYEDLQGKRVVVKKGTLGKDYAELIQSRYDFSIVYLDDSPFMYEEVETGNSAACFEDFPILGYEIAQGRRLKMIHEAIISDILNDSNSTEQGMWYGFAVQKGKNAELLAKFNAGLDHIKANGTYQEILDRYIKTE
ncbi:MAG: hypothetical protein Ta2G_21510 [Termitinemataceae bacterium]|nr:MAG: hypothetical protein Ta2G_21510 [Termitinemataceae bacterium]